MSEPELAATLERALAMHKSGDLAAASGLYRRLLERRPKLVRVLYLLGLATYQAGDPAAALMCLRKALAEAPAHAPARSCLGLALLALGGIGEALQCLRRAVAIQALLADAQLGLGMALARDGQSGAAGRAFARGLTIDPGRADWLGNLSTNESERSRWDAALLWASRMIAVASQMAPAHAKMALALEELHRPTEAATARRRALVLEPRDPASYVRLGRHLVTAKDDDGARTQHRRAAALDAYALAYVVNNLYAASRGRLWLTYDHLRQDLAGR